MTMKRPVQGSLLGYEERPVGAILPSVFARPRNADLIAAVAPLYLTGSVLDVTYGEGTWWQRFKPEPFGYHDLAIDGVDFRALPEADRSYATVVFDPPYVLSGTFNTAKTRAGENLRTFQRHYGIGTRNPNASASRALHAMILDGLVECCRVAETFVLVKCMEYAQSGRFHDIPTMVTNRAAEVGWVKHDQIVHYAGSGPGGHNIYEVVRARRHHSYLICFTRAEP